MIKIVNGEVCWGNGPGSTPHMDILRYRSAREAKVNYIFPRRMKNRSGKFNGSAYFVAVGRAAVHIGDQALSRETMGRGAPRGLDSPLQDNRIRNGVVDGRGAEAPKIGEGLTHYLLNNDVLSLFTVTENMFDNIDFFILCDGRTNQSSFGL